MNDTSKKEIGQRIYELRLKKGYSRECLSERARISTKFLYEIEMKESGFSAQILARLCKALETSADYILFGNENSQYVEQLIKTNPQTIVLVNQMLQLARQITEDESQPSGFKETTQPQ